MKHSARIVSSSHSEGSEESHIAGGDPGRPEEGHADAVGLDTEDRWNTESPTGCAVLSTAQFDDCAGICSNDGTGHQEPYPRRISTLAHEDPEDMQSFLRISSCSTEMV